MNLGNYAESPDLKVKERYREKVSPTGIDPFIIPDKNFDQECLPPVESVDSVVLETSHYLQKQFITQLRSQITTDSIAHDYIAQI